QGLTGSAIEAWTSFAKKASREEASPIYYRIGTLHQELEEHEKAVVAFYRSEALAQGEGPSASDLGRRVEASLEAAGKFAARKQELRERVAFSEEDKEDEVLAEIGAEKITRTMVERWMAQRIDAQLQQLVGSMPAEARLAQKEQMLSQFLQPAQLRAGLQTYLREELLYRKAREGGLADKAEVKQQLRATERSLLAELLVARQWEDQIRMTETALQAHYEETKSNYLPEEEEAAEPLPFDEVRNQVAQDYLAREQARVEGSVLQSLFDEFDVVIHQSVLPPQEGGSE
ncbi:MAG: hypothetical protein AAGJ31_11335, partial [Verrucomicrobiota bacterium]